MESLLQDLRYAARVLKRSPGFSLAVILTLALGIGGNAMVFSVMRAALQRQPPYPEPGRLAMVNLTVAQPGQAADTIGWSYPKYLTMRQASQSLAAAAAIWTQDVTLSGDRAAERTRVESVGPEYFGLLGMQAVHGRVFGHEVESGDARVVVLTDALWRRRYGGDPAVIGRPLTIEGHPFTIIGVMPPDVRGVTGRGDAFVPIAVLPVISFPRILQQRQAHRYEVVARIRDDVTMEQAAAELAGLGRVIAEAHPAQGSASWGASLVPFVEARVNPAGRTAMRILMAGVAIVLLIACVNVANLLMARAASREREIGVRAALGAGRARLVRQTVAETALLAVIGGAAGVVLAVWGVDLLASAMPVVIGHAGSRGLEFLHPSLVRVDLVVVVFAAALSVAVGLVLGLAPLARYRRTDAATVLRGASATERGHGLRRFSGRSALVAAEVALAFVLLAGAGLVSRSLARLTGVDTGFQREGIVTLRYRLPRTLGDSLVSRAHQDILARAAALPGVSSAALAGSPELSGEFDRTRVTRVAGRPPAGEQENAGVGVHYVNAEYFSTLGIPLRDGRTFRPSDDAAAAPVLVISETTARRLFPEQRAVGQRFAIGLDLFGDSAYGEVIGVVADARHVGLGEEPGADVYLHYLQYAYREGALSLRTALPEAAIAQGVRRELARAWAEVPVYDVRTLEQRVRDASGRERVLASALTAFGVLALVLASLGVYGVMSYTMARRTREIGLRMALGAARGRVLRLVVGEGMTLVALGVVAGLVAALAATRVLRTLLYGVGATDPLTFAAMAMVLLAAALLAALIPAARAARVDPMTALRTD